MLFVVFFFENLFKIAMSPDWKLRGRMLFVVFIFFENLFKIAIDPLSHLVCPMEDYKAHCPEAKIEIGESKMRTSKPHSIVTISRSQANFSFESICFITL